MSNSNQVRGSVEINFNGRSATKAIEELRQSALKAREALDQMDESQKNGDNATYVALRKSIEAFDALEAKTKKANIDIEAMMKNLSGTAAADLKRALTNITAQMKKMSETDMLGEKGKKLREQYAAISAQLDKVNGMMRVNTDLTNKNSNALNKQESGLTKTIKRLANYVAVYWSFNQIIGLSRKWVEGNKELSESLTNVRKVTGLTGEEIDRLSKSIDDIDTSTSQLALTQLAYDAGKLGIKGVQNLYEFVRAGNQIKVALGADLGEDAIKNLAKLNDVLGITRKMGVEKSLLATGSAINELGMNSTASEGYLVDFAQRLGGIAAVSNMTMPDLLALGATTDALAQNVEVSATAMNKVIMTMMTDTERVARAAGMSMEELQKQLDVSTMQGLVSVLEGLRDKGGIEQMGDIFKDLGSDGARLKGVIAALVPNVDMLRAQIYISNKGFEEGISVTNEYNMKQQSLGAIMAKTGNRIKESFVNSGMVKTLTEWANRLNNLDVAFRNNHKTVGMYSAAIAMLTFRIIAFKKIITGFTILRYIVILKNHLVILKTHLSSLNRVLATSRAMLASFAGIPAKNIVSWTTAVKALQTGFVNLSKAAWKSIVTMATNPLTWVTAAIGALVGLGVAIYRSATHVTAAQRAWKEYKQAVADVTYEVNANFNRVDRINTQYGQLTNKLKELKKGTAEYATAEQELNRMGEKRNAVIQELNRTYSPYLTNLLSELDTDKERALAKERIIAAMEREQALKGKERVATDIREEYAPKINDTRQDLRKTTLKYGKDDKLAQDLTDWATNMVLDMAGTGASVSEVVAKMYKQVSDKDFKALFGELSADESTALKKYLVALFESEDRIAKATEQYAEQIDISERKLAERDKEAYTKMLSKELSSLETEVIRKSVEYWNKRIEKEGEGFEEYERAHQYLLQAEQELYKRDNRQPRGELWTWSINDLEAEIKVAKEGVNLLKPDVDDYAEKLKEYNDRITAAQDELKRRKDGDSEPQPMGERNVWSIVQLKKDMASAKKELEQLRPDMDDYEAKLKECQDRIEQSRLELLNRGVGGKQKSAAAADTIPSGEWAMWSVTELKADIRRSKKGMEDLRKDAPDYEAKLKEYLDRIAGVRAELISRGEKDPTEGTPIGELTLWSVNELKANLKQSRKELDDIRPDSEEAEAQAAEIRAHIDAVQKELASRGETTEDGTPIGEITEWSVMELRVMIRKANKELSELRPDALDYAARVKEICDIRDAARVELARRGMSEDTYVRPSGELSVWSVDELKKDIREAKKEANSIRPDVEGYETAMKYYQDRIDKVNEELERRGLGNKGGSGRQGPSQETILLKELRLNLKSVETEYENLQRDLNQSFADGQITQTQLAQKLAAADADYYAKRAATALEFGMKHKTNIEAVNEAIANEMAKSANKTLEIEVERQKKLNELYYAADPLKKVREEYKQKMQEVGAFGRQYADMSAWQEETRLKQIDKIAAQATELTDDELRKRLAIEELYGDKAYDLTDEQLVAIRELYNDYYLSSEEALLKSEERKLKIVEKNQRLILRNYNQSDEKKAIDSEGARIESEQTDLDSRGKYGAVSDSDVFAKQLELSEARIAMWEREMEAKQGHESEMARLNGLILAEQDAMTEKMMGYYSKQMDAANEWGAVIGEGLYNVVSGGKNGRQEFVKEMAKMTVNMLSSFTRQLLMEKAFAAAKLALKTSTLAAEQTINAASVAGNVAKTSAEVTTTAAGTVAEGTLQGAKWYSKAIGTLGPIAGPILGALGVGMIAAFITAALNKTKQATGDLDVDASTAKGPAAGMLTYATGKYDAGATYGITGNDGVNYSAGYEPSLRTGVYNRPHFALFSEREPEMVVDGPTTRKLVMNYPDIYRGIMYLSRNGRMPGYATGNMPYEPAVIATGDGGASAAMMAAMQSALRDSARVNAALVQQLQSGIGVNMYGSNGLINASGKASRFASRNRLKG